MDNPLKIAIDARLVPSEAGGVGQFLIGLVSGLGQLQDGPEEYLIVGPWQCPEWLAGYLGPNERIVPARRPSRSRKEQLACLLGPLRQPASQAWRFMRRARPSAQTPPAPPSFLTDGFYEGLGVDVLHFCYHWDYVQSAIPTLFTIHDVPARYYPKSGPSKSYISWLETLWLAAFAHAHTISAVSQCVKQDLIRQCGVSPDRIYVIPNAPTTPAYGPVTEASLQRVRRKFRLDGPFMLYPAQTFAHKNHIRLLEAIAWLRDREGLEVHLVCTGWWRSDGFQIQRRLRELRLGDRVRFLGFIPPDDLRAVYRLAQGLIFPSLFEGAGIPVLEAFSEGTPVACSDIPPLREYAQDAALFFDPTSVESLAAALRRMTADAALRDALRQRGTARVGAFSWVRTARLYRALYRQIAGRTLTEQDRQLLPDFGIRDDGVR